MDHGRSLGLNADADAGTGKLCSLQSHETYVRGVEDLYDSGDHPLLLDTRLHIAEYIIQRNPADGLLDLPLECRSDSDHDLFGVSPFFALG